MTLFRRRRSLDVCVCCGFILAASWLASAALRGNGQVAPRSDKASRTPAERKIDSQLLIEIARHEPRSSQNGAPLLKTGVQIDSKGRALVDVRAEVTPVLLRTVRSLGAVVVSTSSEYRSIVAWIPVLKIKQLAANPGVSAIVPAAQAINNNRP